MNVALIGSVSSSAHALRGLLRGNVEFACVAGLDARHAGRVSDYHDLRPMAQEAGLPYLSFDSVHDSHVAKFFRAHPFDLLFVIGLSQLVPHEVRSLARIDSVGFHPTPLPRGRGRAPVAWTILLNEPAAANLFFLTDEPDAGDIIVQRPVEVLPDDYAQDLIDRTNIVLEDMIVELAPAIREGTLPRIPQDHARATYYPKRTPADGVIDWTKPADQIYRLIRAVSHPYPGAFSFYQNRKVLIWKAARPTPAREHPPGTILAADQRNLLVQTGSDAIALSDLQWADDDSPALPTQFQTGRSFDEFSGVDTQ